MAASANLDFFAAETDQRAVLDFLFSSTDVRVFESYSKFDAELREFRSIDELAAAFPLASTLTAMAMQCCFSCGHHP
jgi:hypothetical protein